MISFRVRFALPCWCSHTKGDFLFIQSSLLAAKQYPKLIMAKEQETKNPNRHSQWLPQAAFSTLCLVSIINPIEGDLKDQSKELKWSVSALSISLVFSSCAIFANYLLLNGKFQDTRVDGVMVSEIIV
jgi:hypothetical protein